MSDAVNIFWFRRDLRLEDNVGLYKALHGTNPVLPIFIFDEEILEKLPEQDARVSFIWDRLQEMRSSLEEYGSQLGLYFGRPLEVFQLLKKKFNIKNIIANRDYEPYALQRDSEIAEYCEETNIGFYTFKDQVIFEQNEIVKDNGDPYVVYTPYMKKWKAAFRAKKKFRQYNIAPHADNFFQTNNLQNLSHSDLGFRPSSIKVPAYKLNSDLVASYEAKRNFPAIDGTSRLGPHLRFGTISVREVVKIAIAEENEVFWQELIWREFFMQILWHFPDTVTKAFKPAYDRIQWRNDPREFERWKKGTTGYPLVDAGMRELNETGYMHNRVRMLVASFLCKHLLIDWRWGEAYFAQKLLDYELASNVGNWQWAAGTGVDAAPYFRIFNPTTQIQKFDKKHEYIKKWVPELNTSTYPNPIVDHKMARERCLKTYKEALS